LSKHNGKEKSLKSPRHHHYIPKFYLEGFTEGSNDEYLWVLDKQQKKQWKAKPENAAHQKDFYRIEVPGVEPDAVENAFGKFENKAASVVKDIIKKRTVPTGENFIILINFVALMAVRIPSYRSFFNGPLEEMNKFALQLMLANPKRFKTIKERMRRDGFEVDEKVSYEIMKRFIERDNYSIKVSQEWHIKNMLDSIDLLIPLLLGRKWSLIIIKDEEDEFICSDSPVTLMWAKPMPPFWGPGFGMKYTELTMPLAKQIALLARFEREPQILLAPKKVIAKLNSRTVMYAERFIYSPRKDFIWLDKDGKNRNVTDLIKILKSKKEGGKIKIMVEAKDN